MARSRQAERRRPRAAGDDDEARAYDDGDAEDEANAYEDEEDAPYEDDEPDARYEDEYEDDDHEGDEDEDGSSREDVSSDEDGSSSGKAGTRRQSNRRMSAATAAQAALRNVAELTTKEPTGITSLASSEDGWAVGVEVVEDKRVPSSADILAVYEAVIDGEDGSLVSYRRERRYSRGQGDR